MPTVPRRDQSTVTDLRPLPSVQAQPGATSEEAFGGGQALTQSSQATQQFATTGIKLAQQYKESMDTAYAEKLDVDLARQRDELMNKMSTDYKGERAVEVNDFADREWRGYLENIDKDIPNDNIRAKVAARAGTYYNQIYKHGMEVMTVEGEKFQKDANTATIEQAINSASRHFRDPDIVEMELGKMLVARQHYYSMHGEYDFKTGKGSPEYELAVAEDRANVVKYTIDNMIAEANTEEQAKGILKYYEENKKYLLKGESKTYKNYVTTASQAIKTAQEKALQEVSDNTNRKLINDSIDGIFSFAEVQRLWRSGELTDSDYNAWVSKYYNSNFAEYQRTINRIAEGGASSKISNPKIFNDIRMMQLSGVIPRAQIERILRDNMSETLTPADARFLQAEMENIKQTPEAALITAEVERIKSYAENVLYTKGAPAKSGFGEFLSNILGFNKKEDEQALVNYRAEMMVQDFLKRTMDSDLSTEQISQIANEVIGEGTRREFPEALGQDDTVQAVIKADGVTRRLFAPPSEKDKGKKAPLKVIRQ